MKYISPHTILDKTHKIFHPFPASVVHNFFYFNFLQAGNCQRSLGEKQKHLSDLITEMIGDVADSGGASGSEVGASVLNHGGAMEERGGSGGENRWPKQETCALLKIRSDMDAVFRDSSLKGPLWEEVSRKMAEHGYHRTAKKCKEKFENVYKYHKRTKDGRASKSDGKNYRFFDQLEALEGNNSPPQSWTQPTAVPPQPPLQTSFATVSSISPSPITVLSPNPNANNPMNSSSLFHSSQPPFQPSIPAMDASNKNQPPQIYSFQTHLPASLLPNATSSSSTSSDEDIQRRRGRKRKWKDFFHRLMKDMIHKQEELHRKFLGTLEKRERERMARDDAWRAQEIARMNREHEILAQERSMAAAKDAAVLAFLQKVTEQQNSQIPISDSVQLHVTPPENSVRPPPMQAIPPPPPFSVAAPAPPPPSTKLSDSSKGNNSGDKDHPISSGSSRWPKTEVQALIKLRTYMDLKYQETGPKGPLWEEISSAMSKLGYSRSAKRCKEKWENINKYFKKVKESSNKRPEDSKTCPYFHQLDAIYREKARPENPMLPIMARPEQQWPLPEHSQPQPHDSAIADRESDHEEEEGEDEDEGSGYEMVANKQQQQPSSTADSAV